MSVEDFIIYVYYCVEDTCRTIVDQPQRSRGFMPKLSDAEVITMEIVGEFMGKDQDKGIWRYFRNHWHDWFPHLGSRANFAKQSANLWDLKRRIQDHIAWQLGALEDTIHLVDGFPMRSASMLEHPAVVVLRVKQDSAIARRKMRNIMALKGMC